MVSISPNFADRHLYMQVVFRGPGRVDALHAALAAVPPGELRIGLTTNHAEGDTTLLFGWSVPLRPGDPRRLRINFTAAEPAHHRATERLALMGADLIVFVGRHTAPAGESETDLVRCREDLERDTPRGLPKPVDWIFAWDGVASEALGGLRASLNPEGAPEASLNLATGSGVAELLQQVVEVAWQQYQALSGPVDPGRSQRQGGGS
jgi:hypothetical protein